MTHQSGQLEKAGVGGGGGGGGRGRGMADFKTAAILSIFDLS